METPCQGKSIAKLIFLFTLNLYVLPADSHFPSGLLIFVQVLSLCVFKGVANELTSSKWHLEIRMESGTRQWAVSSDSMGAFSLNF